MRVGPALGGRAGAGGRRPRGGAPDPAAADVAQGVRRLLLRGAASVRARALARGRGPFLASSLLGSGEGGGARDQRERQRHGGKLAEEAGHGMANLSERACRPVNAANPRFRNEIGRFGKTWGVLSTPCEGFGQHPRGPGRRDRADRPRGRCRGDPGGPVKARPEGRGPPPREQPDGPAAQRDRGALAPGGEAAGGRPDPAAGGDRRPPRLRPAPAGGRPRRGVPAGLPGHPRGRGGRGPAHGGERRRLPGPALPGGARRRARLRRLRHHRRAVRAGSRDRRGDPAPHLRRAVGARLPGGRRWWWPTGSTPG